MNIGSILDVIKKHPDFKRAGMVLIHNGVVRNTSREGTVVHRIQIKPDLDKLRQVVDLMKQSTGIIEIVAEIAEGELLPGDDIMVVAVAGDYREHVFPVLMETVELIKRQVATKQEF